jgi:hypothetical protein
MRGSHRWKYASKLRRATAPRRRELEHGREPAGLEYASDFLERAVELAHVAQANATVTASKLRDANGSAEASAMRSETPSAFERAASPPHAAPFRA